MEFPLLQPPFGLTSSIQLELVRSGLRPACRLSASPKDFKITMEALHERNLKCCVGYDAIVAKPVAGRGGYSEWSSRLPSDRAPEANRYIYVATATKDAERARRADEQRLDAEFGAILGYPTCCVKNFCSAKWLAEADPVLSSYSDHSPIDWHMNVSMLSFDCALLAHVPCSEKCDRSLCQARSFQTHLLETDESVAQHVERALKGAVLHSTNLGIAALLLTGNHPRRIEGVRFLEDSSVLAAILEGSESMCKEDGFVQIGRIGISSTEIRWFEFSDLSATN